jgi:hypothetical protein
MARPIIAIFHSDESQIGFSNATFVYVEIEGPSSEITCGAAIHRLPLEPWLHHVKGPATLHSNLERLCDPMARAIAPPNLEVCDPDGSKCKLPDAKQSPKNFSGNKQ